MALPPALVWGMPYPYRPNFVMSGPRRMPELDPTQARNMARALEKMSVANDRIPDALVALLLNTMNCWDDITLRQGTWIYFHQVTTIPRVPPAGAAGPGPMLVLPADVLTDMSTPWTPIAAGPDRTVGNLPRYRMALFIHRHRFGTDARDVFSMSTWDRESNTITWVDTQYQSPTVPVCDSATRHAQFVNYWRTVVPPPGIVLPTAPIVALPPAAVGNPGHGANANIVYQYQWAHHVEWNGRDSDVVVWRSMFQMISRGLEMVRLTTIPLGGGLPLMVAPPWAHEDNFHWSSGLDSESLPRIFVFMWRILYANRPIYLLPLGYLSVQASISARFRIPKNELWKEGVRQELQALLGLLPGGFITVGGIPAWLPTALGV
ncbi:hypothetical protein F4778DRAFT_734472 [Xylariomycetidae sp. FL2044]|nr:hypothetical protein F4778DRAFT_734472 [Xylariomycetidae sp. FL2044]